MGDPAEGVLGTGAVLHAENADLLPRRQTRVGVRHVQPDALLAHDDGADVLRRGRLDDRVDRVGEEHLHPFGLQHLADGFVDVHGLPCLC